MSTVNYLTARSSNLAAFNTIQLNVSTLTGSTIQTTATATTSSIIVSTLTTRAATYSTLTGSTITTNSLVLSTLTVSSINNGTPGVAAYSTFNASSITTSSITTSTLTVAPGFNSNISNVIYTSLADSGQTAANFVTTGMPGTAPPGSVISGSYRLTAGASSGAALMRLSTFTYIAGTTYNFTFTGMQGSQALVLYVNQYNAAGTASISIGADAYNITTSATTISGSFTANLYPVTYTGTIVFYVQAGAVNQFVNFTAFSMTTGSMNVGIGTASPAASLDVAGSIISRAQTPAIAFLGDIDGAKWTAKLGGYNLSFGSDSGTFTGFESSIIYGRTYQYGIQMNSTGGMHINGNVGIGTASPSTKLHIFETATNIVRMQTSASDSAYIASTYEYIFISANYTVAGVRDNVGRGSAQIALYQPTAGGFITFNTSPSINTAVQERMRILANGNVGIGIANPSVPLQVNGTIIGSRMYSVNGSITVGTSATTIYTTNGYQSGFIHIYWGNGNALYFFQSYVGLVSTYLNQLLYNSNNGTVTLSWSGTSVINAIANTPLNVSYIISFNT